MDCNCKIHLNFNKLELYKLSDAIPFPSVGFGQERLNFSSIMSRIDGEKFLVSGKFSNIDFLLTDNVSPINEIFTIWKQVLEETGFDITNLLNKSEYIEVIFGQQRVRLYIIAGVKDDNLFAPQTKKEISVCFFYPICRVLVLICIEITTSKYVS